MLDTRTSHCDTLLVLFRFIMFQPFGLFAADEIRALRFACLGSEDT